MDETALFDRAAVEKLIQRSFGDDVTVVSAQRIRPWTVARCHIDGSSGPGTVIVKWLRSNPEGFRVDRTQIGIEASALQLLDQLASGVAPRLVAHDADRDLLITEDLAPRRTLHSMLSGGLSPAGVAGLHTFAATMATLHTTTASHKAPAPTDPSARVPISDRGAAELFDRLAPLAQASQQVRKAASLAVRAIEEPGSFEAFSNGDSGANNFLVGLDGGDGRLIDFEHACRRHILLDVAALHVPGSMWMTVADPVPLGIDDTYRRVAGERIAAVLDDNAYGHVLSAACTLRTLNKLQRFDKLDARPPGHHSRRQLVATIDRAVSTLNYWDQLIAIREWLAEVEVALRARWPDADVDVPNDYTLREPFDPDH